MLLTRIISALVAVSLIAALYYFFATTGLLLVCSLVATVGVFEFARLTLTKETAPLHVRVLFILLCLTIFFGTLAFDQHGLAIFVVASVFFLATMLLTVQTKEDLAHVQHLQGMGLLGLFYSGLFPALTTRILFFENGDLWFITLLAIVFAGDTSAYLTGRAFGRHKLLVSVSPKKTIEGALGGLAGSAIAGAIMGVFFLKSVAVHELMAVALVTGVFAQLGDLFESLVKRVADVKDSGHIMPGHGGVLDRVDGVYFASPVFYVLIPFLIP